MNKEQETMNKKQENNVREALVHDNIDQWFLTSWDGCVPATDQLQLAKVVRVRFPTLHVASASHQIGGTSTRVPVAFASSVDLLPSKDERDCWSKRQCQLAFEFLQQQKKQGEEQKEQQEQKQLVMHFEWEEFECLPKTLVWNWKATYDALAIDKDPQNTHWRDRFHHHGNKYVINLFHQHAQLIPIWETYSDDGSIGVVRDELRPALYPHLSDLFHVPFEQWKQSQRARFIDCFSFVWFQKQQKQNDLLGACVVQGHHFIVSAPADKQQQGQDEQDQDSKKKPTLSILLLAFRPETTQVQQQTVLQLFTRLLQRFCFVFGINEPDPRRFLTSFANSKSSLASVASSSSASS